ncbi:MAG TPA: HlyD family efflux transporter periplasmic adaptor subunit [Chromatiaceae bacterium]|nr:HlyD family efflux transporter periplasmic adaptor subunit [Chromatiaceae bacterium]
MPNPSGKSPLDGWPRLRDDLTILETRGRMGALVVLVTDPISGETYEFGAEEWFLLQTFDGLTGADQAIQQFAAEFAIELSYEDIDSFVDSVMGWGLIEGFEPVEAVVEPAPAPDEAGSPRAPLEGDQVEDILPLSAAARHPPGDGKANRMGASSLDEPPLSWVWFDPSALFGLLGSRGLFLRSLFYVVPLLTATGFFALVNNVQPFLADFARFRAPLSLFHNLLFSMITVNLLTQIARGIICRQVGAGVPEFGIRMMIGLIPRFGVRVVGEDDLDRDNLIGLHGGTVLSRLGLLAFALTFWLITRPSGTGLSSIFLLLTVVSGISFFLTINPLINGSGYSLLSVLLGSPDLRQRANRALMCKLTGRPLPYNLRDSNRAALSAYALASMLFLFLLFGLILLFAAEWLEFNFSGTGVVIFLVLAGFLAVRFSSKLKERKANMNQKKADMQQALEARFGPERAEQIIQQVRGGGGGGLQSGGPLPPIEHEESADAPQPSGRRPWKRYVALLALFLVALLPYPFETGGPLQVLPSDRQEIYAEIESFVAEVLHVGNESLVAGTVVATLSSSEQQNDILTTKAKLLEQTAHLQELLNTPTAEDLALAQQRLQTTEVRAKFSRESANRLHQLYKSGDVSLDKYEDAKRKSEIDRLETLEEKANLARIESGPHPQEIEAARYEVQRLEEQQRFYQSELDRTQLIMPIDGRLVTENLHHMVGKYLDKGDLYATVENDRMVRVLIDVPQSDISEVAKNSTVRLKSWAYPERIFEGVVLDIAPVVTEESFGGVITVTAQIDNPDGLLKSGMTGYGKIEGETKMVFIAFTRAFVRFFRIEMWSWIP